MRSALQGGRNYHPESILDPAISACAGAVGSIYADCGGTGDGARKSRILQCGTGRSRLCHCRRACRFILQGMDHDLKWKNVCEEGIPHEAKFLKLDCSHIKYALGWKPCWDIRTAIEKNRGMDAGICSAWGYPRMHGDTDQRVFRDDQRKRADVI